MTEMDHHDVWQSTTIACALITTDRGHTHRILQRVTQWVDSHWPDVTLVDDHIELI